MIGDDAVAGGGWSRGGWIEGMGGRMDGIERQRMREREMEMSMSGRSAMGSLGAEGARGGKRLGVGWRDGPY